MKLKNLIIVVLMIASAATSFAQMPPIPVDTAVRIGKLPNGLTYYIRHNNWPENRAEFYIAQRVGSIQEEDNQRGSLPRAHVLQRHKALPWRPTPALLRVDRREVRY